ncbi:alpha/beta hydrolase family protein [Bacteroides sp. f07]|uniref:alpha/beta hydrolase family protein n=1 Tax=Bacteroides sp. f07 TaxID=3132704 RepID=UPI0036F361B0
MRRMIIAVILVALSMLNIMASDDNISGAWHGSLRVTPQMELKIVFNFNCGEDGKQSVTLDSPDQGAYGIAGEVNFLSSDSVNVSVRRIGLSFAGKKQDGKIIGQCRQGTMTADLGLLPGAMELKRPQMPKPPYPYATKNVIFNNPSANATLSGTLTLPEDYSSDTPAVIMVTGSGLQNRDEEIFGHKPFAVIADYLARNGIVSLRYDDRGFGESTGDGRKATTKDFAQDAKIALEYLRKKENFKNVGILGHSEGATIAFMLGAECDSDLFANPSFIIAIGAQAVRGDSVLVDQSATLLGQRGIPLDIVADYVDALQKLYRMKAIDESIIPTNLVDTICADWQHNQVYASLKSNLEKMASDTNPWLNYYIRFTPSQYIATTACPIFVLYGERDIQVRPELNMPKMQQLANEATIKLYPGLNHLFQHAKTGAVQEYGTIEETISPEVLVDIVDFIAIAVH